MPAMALNIKDPEAERLAGEVAALAGESKTGAVREALRERKARLLLAQGGSGRGDRIVDLLERRLWPNLPDGVRGSTISKDEEERILGFEQEGV
jgi:antitoxin VapB